MTKTMMTMNRKSYRELITIPTFEERLKYLTLYGAVGEMTFGGHRYLNQLLYKCPEWRRTRRDIVLRDEGFDLAHPEYPIYSPIYIHHINPITIEDLIKGRPIVFDPDNLVSTSFGTHQKIHYGYGVDEKIYKERTPNDTCPWK